MKLKIEEKAFEFEPPIETSRVELGLVGNRRCVLIVGKALNAVQMGHLTEEEKRGDR